MENIDLTREKLDEMARDIALENRLRNDFDFALEYFNVDNSMSVEEFGKAYKKLKHYYPDLTPSELLETLDWDE